MGEKFSQAIPLIKYFGFAILPLALLYIPINYLVATMQVKKITYLLFMAAVLQVVLVVQLHNDQLINVIKIIFVVGLITFLLSLLLVKNRGTEKNL